MKLNIAIVISAATLLAGFFFHQPYLWIPVSVLLAAVIDLYTRQWVMSDRLGSAQNLSMFLKMVFATAGFYAMIGQIACITLAGWWLFS
jgi:hypothetical protein